MRATTRGTTRSARARWGARCVGIGLTTALAVTFGAGPASADPGPQLQAAVPPVENFENNGNPNCPDINGFALEIDTDNEPVDGEMLAFSFNNQSGTITLDVTDNAEGEPELLGFSFSGPFAAGAVIVKGGPSANIYDYRPTMAGAIEADVTLHSPINPSGGFAALSHVAFCIVPDGSNT